MGRPLNISRKLATGKDDTMSMINKEIAHSMIHTNQRYIGITQE